MNIATRFEHPRTEQIREELVKAGVNDHFVAELDDEVAEELLERITRLLIMHKEQNRQP
jgi:hypothetical protein